MRTIQLAVVCVAVLVATAGQVQAGIINSYKMTNVRLSGFGSWGHTYFGSITPSGSLHDYSGGSGTINDGVIGTGPSNTHFFETADQSTTTLFLDQIYSQFSEIRLYSFVGNNGIPGNITSVDVTIGGMTQTISTTGFGAVSFDFGGTVVAHPNSHELLSLVGTSLEFVTGDSILLSNVQTISPFSVWYSISEATFVASQSQVVPEPTSFAMFGIGACVMGFRAARRRRFKKNQIATA